MSTYREGDADRTLGLRSFDGGVTWVPDNDVIAQYDFASSATIYVGSAPRGTSTSATGWQITKYDLTSTSAAASYATDVSWVNRASGSYS
jgi:hypothetical protein